MKKDNKSKLDLWQDRLKQADYGYNSELAKMDHREELYNGTHEVGRKPSCDYQYHEHFHVRNIIFENIESEVSSNVPQPKVTPTRQKDEYLADIIEHWLRNELDRLPFEAMNDMTERTVPIQGGVGWLVSWNNHKRTHNTIGALEVNVIHPKQFAPQPAVYTGINDMDWFITKIPTTKGAIKRRYDKDVYAENESEPDIRTATGAANNNEDAVTQYIGYEINENGNINRFSWVNDVVLEDIKDYQARHQPVCAKCGKIKPLPGQLIYANVKKAGNLLPDPKESFAGGLIPKDLLEQDAAGQSMASSLADSFMSGEESEGVMSGINYDTSAEPKEYDGGACPFCGSTDFSSESQEYEEVMLPIETKGGVSIPGATPGMNEFGQPVMKPTKIPFYKPDIYPIVIQKNVSVYGQLLGNSDVDAIEDQQNTINIIEQKIVDRLLKAGTRITLPDRADFRISSKDSEIWYIGNAVDKNLIGTYDFTGNLQYELAFLAQVYEEARQVLGITDSFQGRRDTTAVSGKAKEIAASQSAGRLESKRVMKDSAYAQIFELMFKFALAYSDEPRTVSYTDEKGKRQYQEFNRYDFLEQDEDGNYYWNDQFLFSVDSSTPLASNREEMWRETRENLVSGAFGNPQELETLILFWGKMEQLHYPGAKETKAYLEDRLQAQQEQMMMQQQMMAQQMMMGMPPQQPQQPQQAVPNQPMI